MDVDIIGTNGAGATNIDGSIAKSKVSSTTYNNSQITANNNITINTNNNTDIRGANILAKNNLNLTTGNNLNIESLQDVYNSKSDSFGFSLGFGGSAGMNGGANISTSKATKRWVTNQTDLIGQNSVTINTGNNTNLVGSVIANKKADGTDGGNLTINTTSLTYSNIMDKDKARSVSLGGSYGNNTRTNEQQSGSLSFGYSSRDVEQVTKATIGQGAINITNNSNISSLNRDITKSQELTKYQVVDDVSGRIIFFSEEQKKEQEKTSFEQKARQWLRPDKTIIGSVASSAAANGNLELANSINDGQKLINQYGGDLIENSIVSGVKQTKKGLQYIGEGLESTRLLGENNIPLGIGYALTTPISLVEGTIFTFFESNDVNGSQSYRVNNQGQIVATNDVSQTKFYNVNGIMTPEEVAKMNYLNKSKNENLTIRHNPSHGFLGDLVESGIGKATNLIGVPELVAMNNIVADDLYQRSHIEGGINTFHSQGTIIGTGAAKIYGKYYQENNPISKTQIFNAVGPAVLEEDWRSVIKDNLNIRDGEGNIGYKHNDKDPVRYLAAPSNLLGSESPVYILNPIDIVRGVVNSLNMKYHDVTDKNYIQYFAGPELKKELNQNSNQP